MMRQHIHKIIVLVGHLAFVGPIVAQPNAAANRFEITPEHVISINGKKTFTIGFTFPPQPDAVTPSGKPALKEFRDAGAVFIRTGPRGSRTWDEDWIAEEHAYMEAAAEAGMYCLPHLKELGALDPDDVEGEQALRRIVRMFKDHPGMGVWKGFDEPQWNDVPAPAIVRSYEIVKEEDPQRPLWTVQAPRGTVDELREYNPGYDIGGVDIYPVSYPMGRHVVRAEKNKDISLVGDYTQKMLEVVDGDKPIWLTLQIAWSGTVRPGRTLRFPTYTQQRFMTYQAIINGARGLIYFGGHVPVSLAEHDRPYGWNWTYWDRILRPVIEQIGDKSPLAEALCAPESPLPIEVTGNDIEFCVREVGRDVYILACCRDPQRTAEVTFTGLPPELGEGDVLYESPRKVVANEGTFSDWFAPYDVHVYRFTRPPSQPNE